MGILNLRYYLFDSPHLGERSRTNPTLPHPTQPKPDSTLPQLNSAQLDSTRLDSNATWRCFFSIWESNWKKKKKMARIERVMGPGGSKSRKAGRTIVISDPVYFTRECIKLGNLEKVQEGRRKRVRFKQGDSIFYRPESMQIPRVLR